MKKTRIKKPAPCEALILVEGLPRCGRPAGHGGPHTATVHTAACPYWLGTADTCTCGAEPPPVDPPRAP
jgi:hypothetical protein